MNLRKPGHMRSVPLRALRRVSPAGLRSWDEANLSPNPSPSRKGEFVGWVIRLVSLRNTEQS